MFGVDKSINEHKLLAVNEELVDGFFNHTKLDDLEARCNKALNIHDINLTFLDAGVMFVNAFDNYIKNECRPDNLDLRSKDCYKLVQALEPTVDIKYAEFKNKYIRFVLNRDNAEEKYNEIRDRFLMTDIEGGLYERFHIDFDEMYQKTGMEGLLKETIDVNCS